MIGYFTNPINTISSVKRFMGRRFDEVTEEIKHWSYKVAKGDNNTVRIDIDGRLYTPQEISAMVLQKMKKIAEDYLGHEVTEAVVTVPAVVALVAVAAFPPIDKLVAVPVRPVPAPLNDVDVKTPVEGLNCNLVELTNSVVKLPVV